jgi:hypothetical protein
MQNAKGTQSCNESQQDKQSKVGQQCGEGSTSVVDESLNVNENDVRNESQHGEPR